MKPDWVLERSIAVQAICIPLDFLMLTVGILMAVDKRYFYRRYIDDIIVLAKTRWHLRCAIRTVNQHFNALKLAQAPDKTFIGRIEKGFDFLGYRFGSPHLAVAEKTISNAVNNVI